MLSSLLEVQDDEHPFRNAFLLWSMVVVGLVLWSRHLKRRERAAQMIDPAAAGGVGQVRERIHRQRGSGGDGAPDAAAGAAAAAPPGEREDCPVCLDQAKFPIDTNCAHTFCCACFMQYHEQSGGVLRAMVRCPCCRRNVDLIAQSEPGWTAEEKTSEQGRSLLQQIATYNRRFSNEPRSWQDAAQDTPHLLSRMWRELTTGGVDSMRLIRQLRFWVLLLTGAAYLLSPFDLIPEAILGLLGYADDIIVLLVVGVMMASTFRNVMQQSAQQQHA